jgi:hypothetical protein
MAPVQLRESRSVAPGGALSGSAETELTLLELLDRVLDKGVVLCGDITLSVADVDLVYVGLRVLVSSVEAMHRQRYGE